MLQNIRRAALTSVRVYSTQSTVHEDELNKFRKIANEWWDLNGSFRALHSFNRLRVPFIRDGIILGLKDVPTPNASNPLLGCEILDVGCGGGILAENLAKLGARVTAIDPCTESIDVAEEHARKMNLSNLTYRVDSVEGLKASTSQRFDAITASEVIEHVDNPELFFSTCVDLLKPGGSLHITTINRTTASWVLAIGVAEYLIGLIPRGTHDWNKFVTPDELISYAKSYACRVRRIHGLSYNPLNNSWYWTRNTAVNYAMHFVKDCEDASAMSAPQSSSGEQSSPVQEKES